MVQNLITVEIFFFFIVDLELLFDNIFINILLIILIYIYVYVERTKEDILIYMYM